jgi:hypothetical protein
MKINVQEQSGRLMMLEHAIPGSSICVLTVVTLGQIYRMFVISHASVNICDELETRTTRLSTLLSLFAPPSGLFETSAQTSVDCS